MLSMYLYSTLLRPVFVFPLPGLSLMCVAQCIFIHLTHQMSLKSPPGGRLGFICHIVFCPLSFFRIYLCSTHKHKSCADRRICLCIDCHTRDAPKSIAFTWPLFLPSSPARRETLRVVIFRNLTARYEQGGVLFAVFEGKFRPKS